MVPSHSPPSRSFHPYFVARVYWLLMSKKNGGRGGQSFAFGSVSEDSNCSEIRARIGNVLLFPTSVYSSWHWYHDGITYPPSMHLLGYSTFSLPLPPSFLLFISLLVPLAISPFTHSFSVLLRYTHHHFVFRFSSSPHNF